jgi:hypothetical protein
VGVTYGFHAYIGGLGERRSKNANRKASRKSCGVVPPKARTNHGHRSSARCVYSLVWATGYDSPLLFYADHSDSQWKDFLPGSARLLICSTCNGVSVVLASLVGEAAIRNISIIFVPFAANAPPLQPTSFLSLVIQHKNLALSPNCNLDAQTWTSYSVLHANHIAVLVPLSRVISSITAIPSISIAHPCPAHIPT